MNTFYALIVVLALVNIALLVKNLGWFPTAATPRYKNLTRSDRQYINEATAENETIMRELAQLINDDQSLTYQPPDDMSQFIILRQMTPGLVPSTRLSGYDSDLYSNSMRPTLII